MYIIWLPLTENLAEFYLSANDTSFFIVIMVIIIIGSRMRITSLFIGVNLLDKFVRRQLHTDV